MDSGLGDFVKQIPPAFELMFCGSGILLLLVASYMIFIRRRREQRMPPVGAPPLSFRTSSDIGDLPDLDVLASTEMFAVSPAAPVAAAPAAAAPAVRSRPTSTYRVDLAEGGSVEAVEVLTVLRDVADGGLIIQIGSSAYRNPPATADAEFKRRFRGTLRDLNQALSTATAAPVSPPASAGDAVSGAPPPVEADADLDMPEIGDLPAHHDNAAASPGVPMPGDLPKFKLPDTPPVKPKRGQRPVAEPIPEINIAASIEAFLQHRLERAPQYAGRSIHVRPASHGGVTIEVDGRFYDSVSEVDDPEARAFLAGTIEEWQARQ